MNAAEGTIRSVLVIGAASELTDRIVDRFRSWQPPARVAHVDRIQGAEPIAAAMQQQGTVDVLVVDATEELDADPLEVGDDQMGSALERLAEAFFWSQAAAACCMRDRGEGVIVVVGTVDGYHSESGGAVRSMVQGGMLGLVRGLGVEWAPSGIRVIGVARSIVPTRSGASRTPPIGRHPTAAEVAEAVAFVASADASYLTAETIRVDGGFVAYQMF
jgi:NAD(P)-dependent dehydrogenase (short-subunit alcohol dehydrogenase family)